MATQLGKPKINQRFQKSGERQIFLYRQIQKYPNFIELQRCICCNAR